MGLRQPRTPQAPRAPLPEFDVQRKKVEQRIGADTQGQQDAVQRRLAASGMLNSGAAIKQQNIIAQQGAAQREDALQGVDAAEIGEQQRRQEIQDNRDFAANESKLGRDFQGQESAMARALQGSQFDRNFEQQGSQFDRNFAQQGDQFGKQFGLSEKQFDLQNKQYLDDKMNTDINKGISFANLDDKQIEKANAFYQQNGIQLIPTAKKAAPAPTNFDPRTPRNTARPTTALERAAYGY